MGKLRQTTAKIQELLDKVENGEAGGGGLKYSVERKVYTEELYDGIELTEEQRAYNIETFNIAYNGEFVTINLEGMLLAVFDRYKDNRGRYVEFTIYATLSGISLDYTLRIYEDGSVVEASYGTNPTYLYVYYPTSFVEFFADQNFHSRRALLSYSGGYASVTAMVEETIDERRIVVMNAIGVTSSILIGVDKDTGEVIEQRETPLGGTQVIIVYPTENSERNKQAYEAIYTASANNSPFMVYALHGASLYLATAVLQPSEAVFEKVCAISFSGWRQTEHHPDRTEKEFYQMMLYPDGKSVLITSQDYVIDNVVSDESSNPIANKAIKAYVDEKVGQGGGLKYSEERTLYGINEEVLTDEQKAYNAETYSKMWGGEAVTINVGGVILTPYFATEDDGFVRFEISLDKVQVIIKLRSDGSVEVSYTYGSDDSLVIEYGNAESAKAVFADHMFFYKRIVLWNLVFFIDLHIKSLPITTDGKTVCMLGYEYEGTEVIMVYDVDTGEILEEATTSDTLKVYIDVSNTEDLNASYNRDAVSGQNTYKNLVVGDNYSLRAVYYPLYSYKTDNSNIEVVIYRNGAFQRWIINADGTSTLTA